MLVIENCNSLSDLRQKIIYGEEIRTARHESCEDQPCDDVISRQATIVQLSHNKNGDDDCDVIIQKDIETIKALPPVNPQPKTGHWIYKIYGGFHEQGNWYCSHCDYRYNYGNGHAKFCPECGYEMSEPSTEEVIKDSNYEWVIRR